MPARAAAVFLLLLSAPLAVWSNSSLETVPFALAFMALIAASLTAIDVRPACSRQWCWCCCASMDSCSSRSGWRQEQRSRRVRTVRAGEPCRIRHRLQAPRRTNSIDINFRSVTSTPVRLRLRAVRLMGQPPALGEDVIRRGIPLN